MSTDATLLNKLIKAGAKLENVIACHNFYPHEFTGLSVAHFEKMNQLFKEAGIETAAFVNAQTATEGPWPLSEGLCTVEDHRHLPIELQAALLIATEHIDNILIANQFITEEELQKLTQRINEEVMVLPGNLLSWGYLGLCYSVDDDTDKICRPISCTTRSSENCSTRFNHY